MKMAPKRKVEVTAIDESAIALYPTFCNVANQLSQLYSRALNHHKLAFEAGQRHAHALEKLNERIAMKQQEGIMVTVADISAYLQMAAMCDNAWQDMEDTKYTVNLIRNTCSIHCSENRSLIEKLILTWLRGATK